MNQQTFWDQYERKRKRDFWEEELDEGEELEYRKWKGMLCCSFFATASDHIPLRLPAAQQKLEEENSTNC